MSHRLEYLGRSLFGPGPIASRLTTSAAGCPGPRAPSDHAARRRTRSMPLVQCQFAVYDDIADSSTESMRILVSCVILYRVRVEDHNIRERASLKPPTIVEGQMSRR